MNKLKRLRDDEVSSGSDTNEEYQNESEKDSEAEYETAHQTQVRLKKQYIKKLKADIKSRKVEDVDEEVRKTLEEEALDKEGKLMKDVSKLCIVPQEPKLKLSKGKYEVTCLTYSVDGRFIYTGSTTGDIIKWDSNLKTEESLARVKGGRRHSKHPFHKSRITAIATNSEYLATGDLERKIFIWDLDLIHKKTLSKHRNEITSLVFRRNSGQLFSGDKKGIILVWDMILMDTINELLGHTSPILSLDSDLADTCVSCSGIPEPCVKFWKNEKGSVALFNLPKKSTDLSLETISMINERYFVAGSTSNKILLWDSVSKAYPIDVVSPAHDLPENPAHFTTTEINVVSISAMKHTRVFASGSNMSQVKVWNLVPGKGENLVIQLLFVLPDIIGCCNGLQFSPNGKDLAVALSNRHRRHNLHPRIPSTRSSVKIFNILK